MDEKTSLLIVISNSDLERIKNMPKENTDYQTTLRLYDAIRNGNIIEFDSVELGEDPLKEKD